MKQELHRIIRKFGYDIVRFSPSIVGKDVSQLGNDPLDDMAAFLRNDRPMVFDVGANVGQSIRGFRSRFPRCIIHSFEPSPATFDTLTQQASQLKDVHLWNCALGSVSGQMTLLENSHSDMSSFLPISKFGWGEVIDETLVEVKTIDEFCDDQHIEWIDILKSDTQGFDLEVFKGAERTIRADKIALIYCEIKFSDMYKGLPSFATIYDFLTSRGFLLVSLYKFYYQQQLASWTDALFVHKTFTQASA